MVFINYYFNLSLTSGNINGLDIYKFVDTKHAQFTTIT